MSFYDTLEVSDSNRTYLSIIETYHPNPFIIFVTPNGVIFQLVDNFPIDSANPSPTESALQEMFPDRSCSCCNSNTDSVLQEFVTSSFHSIPRQIRNTLTISFEITSVDSYYICDSCVDDFNTTAETLIQSNSSSLVANII